ncbi:MAG: hypothetical protein VYA34_15165 [Myxococcota bacterium]|nr:hypothetical protein [Myxococcota bacterium]
MKELCDRESGWLRVCNVAVAVAQGELGILKKTLEESPMEEAETLQEIILQCHLFCGYPRSINGMKIFGEVFSVSGLGESSPSQWREEGEALCEEIYGRAYEKLLQKIEDLHPALKNWMLETGYGRVLSRKGASIQERELGVVAVLIGQRVGPQLSSHLRGALRVGIPEDFLASLLAGSKGWWGETCQREALETWERVLNAWRQADTAINTSC